jgi:multiple sugar transport system ATP-binding protein
MTMADKIVVLREGRIEQVGSPLTLYNTPANIFVAGFIGSPRMNLVPAAAAVAGGARLPVPDALTIGIRPEHADVAAEGPLRVHITQVEQLGGSSLLHGRIADDLPFEIVLQGQTEVRRGDIVGVALPADRLHSFGRDGRRL